MSNGILTYGFLRTCIDKRFVEASRKAFETVPGIDNRSDAYWHESYAGGSARDPSLVKNDPNTGNNIYADQYAYNNGARIFGWQAHIDDCGGLPGASNTQIEEALDKHIEAMIEKYGDCVHYRLLASEKDGVKIRRVHPL